MMRQLRPPQLLTVKMASDTLRVAVDVSTVGFGVGGARACVSARPLH